MLLPAARPPGLNAFLPLGLEDLEQAGLMDRQEYKLLLPLAELDELLHRLQGAYRVLTVGASPVQGYRSLYYDTAEFGCYLAYHNGRAQRHKVRWRLYCSTETGFMELKRSGGGRTRKARVPVPTPELALPELAKPELTSPELEGAARFLRAQGIDAAALHPALDVTYERVTLVRTRPTPERLTLDLNLRLTSALTGEVRAFPGVVVAELKCTGEFRRTHFAGVAHALGLRHGRLSKYGVGCALHYPGLRHNLLLPQLRRLERAQQGGH